MQSRLRLAVYGHVNQGGGSGPGSNYLLLEELLRRGHFVDLYAISGFVGPQGLESFPNFRYFPIAIRQADCVFSFVHERLPQRIFWLLAFLVNIVRHWLYYRKIERIIASQNRRDPYDSLLVLDVLMPFRRNPALHCINWPQSTPLGELEGIQHQKELITRLCSRWLYWGLTAYYHYRVWSAQRAIRHSDKVICCSSWTASSWARLGVEAEAVSFALRLNVFRPAEETGSKSGPVRFLHLGRLVPRKRLDLLVEGFRLLRRERPDVELLIIGRIAYAKGYEALLEAGQVPMGVEQSRGITRTQVPELLRSVDVLVQTSEFEDFGSAVMEAQASGVPVVVGPTNGTKDFISESSFIFREYTSEAVRDAMRAAAHGVRSDRARLAAEARRAAEANFSVAVLTDRILSIVTVRDGAGRKSARQQHDRVRSKAPTSCFLSSANVDAIGPQA